MTSPFLLGVLIFNPNLLQSLMVCFFLMLAFWLTMYIKIVVYNMMDWYVVTGKCSWPQASSLPKQHFFPKKKHVNITNHPGARQYTILIKFWS